MPKVEVEFCRTRHVTISETGMIEIHVPQHVLDADDINSWLEKKYQDNSEFARKVDAAAEASDESEKIDWESAEQIP